MAGTVRARGSDFAQLAKRINKEGLLERRPRYYALRTIGWGLLFAAGVALFLLVGESWWQVAVAAVWAVAFAQFAFLSHDVGHLQVFRRRRPSAAAGRLLGNLGIGLGWEWWTDKHTRHHTHPNHEEHDPDVSPAVIVWSREQAVRSHGLPRFIAKYQAFWFFPILTLEAWHLHIASFRALLRSNARAPRLETALLAAHFAWYLGLVFGTLSPGKAIVFILVHQGIFGIYLGCTFAPNHKGMPVLNDESRLDYLRRQVLTARNVRGGMLVETALGGLNYQIEHHLFPNMPTPHLRRAQPIVRAYCAELGVDYLETGLLTSYGQALRHLHDVGSPLRGRASR